MKKHLLISRFVSFILLAIVISTLMSCRKTVKEYYPSGKLMAEKNYCGQKLDGKFTYWFESGVIQQQALYRKDKLDGTMTRLYGNGNKERQENYVNGLKYGKAVSWDTEGNITEERNYKNDTLDGPYTFWYPTGIPKVEGHYKSGLYHGKWQYFSEIGIKVGEGNFNKGTGVLFSYDHLGHKTSEVNLEGNKKHGKEIRFNPDGSIRETMIYDHDKLVKVLKGQ